MASCGFQQLVEALLVAGANPNAVDANNQNSLTIALIRRYEVIARRLIATGMDLTTTVVALTNVLEGEALPLQLERLSNILRACRREGLRAKTAHPR
jgi:hypothetical protein